MFLLTDRAERSISGLAFDAGSRGMTRMTKMRLYNSVGIALWACAAAVVISALSGCDYQNEKPSTETALTQIDRPVGYDEVNTKVFKKYCLECHSSRGPVLSDYSSTKAGGDLIRKAVL